MTAIGTNTATGAAQGAKVGAFITTRAKDLDDSVADHQDVVDPCPQTEREPPSLEDDGDSDRHTSDLENWFDFAGIVRDLPSIRSLPSHLRPKVRYEITKGWGVKPLMMHQNSPRCTLRAWIVFAIAKHLQEQEPNISLATEGDWIHIPGIRGDEGLLALMKRLDRKSMFFPDADAESSRTSIFPAGMEDLSHSHSRMIRSDGYHKHFAILLPSGDIVSVHSLLTDPRQRKKATLAGARAFLARKCTSNTLAAEEWSDDNWKEFKKNELAKPKRAHKRVTEEI